MLPQSFGASMHGSLSSIEKDTLITELQAKVIPHAPRLTCQILLATRHKSHTTNMT
jgi:hypothetical protein